MNNIKRHCFVESVVEIPSTYGAKAIPAGTPGRVWKVKRDGTIYVSFKERCETWTVKSEQVKMIAGVKNEVKIGDLFLSSWGYEQTNLSFFQVTGVTTNSVKVRGIDHDEVTTGMMCGEGTPVKDSFRGDEKIHRLSYDADGKPSFRVNSYSYAYPAQWGEKHYCSWGH
jgi:hypothetical protein